MRITLVAPCKDLSGGIKVIAKHGNMLIDNGHEVAVIYPKNKDSLLRKWKNFLNRWLRNEKDHLDHFRGDLRAVPALDEHTVPNADIIVATAWETAEWVRDLSDSKGKKVYFIQGYEVWNAQKDRVHDTLRLPFKKITISKWLKDLVEEITGDTGIDIIANASDHQLEDYDNNPSGRIYDIGMTYSPIPNKGADIGIEVMQCVKSIFPKARFVLFGTESPDTALPDDTSVFVRPSQQKITEIYRQTKVWINTSYEEGFCLPCLEAASAGAAVISADNKGVREIISDEENGYITPAGDAEAMVERLSALLSNAELLESMQRKAHSRSKEFSWQRSGEKFSAILSELAGVSTP